MNTFDTAWNRTGLAEGGYVNDPSDSGGETNWGITKRVARQAGYTGPMKELTQEQARAIGKKAYWDSLGLDGVADVCEELALEIFDTGFNMGQGRVAKFFQRSLNVFNNKGEHYPDIAVDGAIGGGTIRALRSLFDRRGNAAKAVMLNAMNCLQGVGYIELAERRPKDEKYMWGWFTHRVTIE